MRSITFVQAFQYWLKLTALLVPAAAAARLAGDGATNPADVVPPGSGDPWSLPLGSGGAQGLYVTYSLIVATFLGTMGLPHVAVRFYTNPDGRAARRTTVAVLVLLGAFYLLPPVYAALGRVYAPELVGSGRADVLVLELPQVMVPGFGGELLAAPRDRRRVRRVPVDLVRPLDRGRGRASQDITSRRAGATASPPSGSRPSSRSWCRARWRSPPPTSGSPGPSGWPSRWRRPPSARCCCWGSGGAA